MLQTVTNYSPNVVRKGTTTLQVKEPNNDDPMKMRPMQEAGFETWQSSSHLHMMIRAAMASGKTNLVKYIMGSYLENNNKRALIVVPKCNIGFGYAEKSILSYPVDWVIPDIEWNILTKEHFTDTDSVFVKFVNWLKTSNQKLTENTRRGVISHVTFARLVKEGYGDLLKDIIINIDEAHHIAHDGDNGNNLGDAINYVLNNADKQAINLIFTTATPSRTDSFKLIGDSHQVDFAEYEYNFAQYLDDSSTVKGYDYKILSREEDWITITKDEHLIKRGDKVIVFMPGENNRITSKVKMQNVRDWIVATGDKYTHVNFDEKGMCIIKIKGKKFKIINLVEAKYQNKGMEYIRNHSDDVDIILTVKIFAEGSDWTPANKAIIYGIRGSIVELIQSIGRIFRQHPKKVGKRSIVNIVHVLPHIDLENTARESYNDMLKAINLALVFKSVNLPMDYVVLNQNGEGTKRHKFNYIVALREELPDITDDDLYGIFDKVADVVINEYHIHGKDMSMEEFNEHAMRCISKLLTEQGVSKQTDKIAEMLVLSNLQERRLATLRDLTNIDVSEIDYNLISEINIAEVYMCGKKPKEFWDWHSKEFYKEKQKGLDKVRQIGILGGNVSSTSEDEIEAMLGRWQAGMKNARAGTVSNGTVFYECYQDEAIRLGFPNMFVHSYCNGGKKMSGEAWAIKCGKECIAFRNEHGRWPNMNSTDKKEQELAAWRRTMIGVFNGINRGIPYESVKKLDNGKYPDFLNPITFSKTRDNMTRIIKEIKKYGVLRDVRLKQKLSSIKTDNGERNKIAQKMAKAAGLFDLMKSEKEIMRERSVKKTQECIDFRNKYGRWPSKESKNKHEKGLGMFINKARQAKKKNSDRFFYECQTLAEAAGFPDMFNLTNTLILRIATALKRTQECIDFRNKYGRWPNSNASNKNERGLGYFLCDCRSGKRGGTKKVFYPECQTLAVKAGYPDMFESHRNH